MLIVEQSAAIQVNGLSAGQPWLMSDLEGQPAAQQQTPVTFTLTAGYQCRLSLAHHASSPLQLLVTVNI